jgi:hypothetical protein
MEEAKHGGKREGAGRKPGSVNKLSTTVKQNVINVFDRLGGEDHMVNWAQENPNQFYNLYAKLMPTQSEIGTMDGQDSPLNVTLNFVKPDNDNSTS